MKNYIFLIALFLLFGQGALGQSLIGTWGYQTYPRKNQICVYGHKISNNDAAGRTGTLKVALYATKRPYRGGRIYGYCLFEKRFDPLHAGYYYKSVNKIGKLQYPPKGSYYMTILLLEYNYGDYEIVDWVNMNGVARF